jgi:hypothetical protein
MKKNKFRIILFFIVVLIIIFSYCFDTENNTFYLQSDIYEFREKYLTAIILTITMLIMLAYLVFLKFRIRDKIMGFLIVSFYSFAVVLLFRTLIISFLLFINRMDYQKNVKIDYYYFKEMQILANIKTGKGKAEIIFISSKDFRKMKITKMKIGKMKNKEVVTIKFKTGILGINFLN